MMHLLAAGLAVLVAVAPVGQSADPPATPPSDPFAPPPEEPPKPAPTAAPPPAIAPSEPEAPPPDPNVGPFVDAMKGQETPKADEGPPIDPAALVEQFRPYLAESWLREVSLIMGSKTLVPENFEPMLDLVRVTTDLAPNDVEIWRTALSVARICAPGVPSAVEFERTILSKLVQLDPTDEVARLLRLLHAVESFETAEERLAAFEKLLTPESRQALGPVISSRLVFEKALLQSRMGDIDGFARSLAEALTLDPAFPAAAELAAGFFASRVANIGEAAELLVATIVANPARLASYLDLGMALLSEGAYSSAVRVYQLAAIVAQQSGAPRDEMTTIVCDLTLAQWGSGDAAGAHDTLRTFIRQIDEEYRRTLHQRQPERPASEIEAEHATLPLFTATLFATTAMAAGAPELQEALERLTSSYDKTVGWITEQGDEARNLHAAFLLEGAWARLLLGQDTSDLDARLDEADKLVPMAVEARQRFDGWKRYRAGDRAGAIEILRPISATDTMARLGLALALLDDGQTREGARELLAVANAERGTALGMMAADALERIVGVRPGPGPSAAALEAALAALPQGFDQFVANGSRALGLKIEPEHSVVATFEPARFRLTLTNLSPLTLAIDPQGPIEARAACSVSLSSVGYDPGDLPPMLVSIDRRLQLAPRESMTFIFDASLGALGGLTSLRPFAGATVTARCVVNFRPMTPRVLLGFMGREALSPPIRVEGARVDEAWVKSTWAEISREDRLADPRKFVLICHYFAAQEDRNDRPRMLALHRHWQQLAEIWSRYPPLVQAWIVMVAPNTIEADSSFNSAVRESNDPMVMTSYMLRRAKLPTDAVFESARRVIDPRLGRLADGVQRLLERQIEERRREAGFEP